MAEIERLAGEHLRGGERLLSLGGDHSITYPLLRAHAAVHGPLTILHLDAHPDLYDELDGSRLSHACPFARILEEGLCARLVQVGIRTLNPHQREQARRFGVEMHEARTWEPHTPLHLDGPLYLSLDLDVLDPSFAPGVSHHEPGGLSVRDVLRIVQGIKGPIVGADLVEYNPTRDSLGATAMVGAKFLKEILGKMVEAETHA
jgi:agmatinase